jgi:cobalt-zinc-cadmium efflux system outer membrane protein
LGQELEIGGQRGLRRESAQAEVEAREKRVLLARRDVAATALIAFYDALAAREEQVLAERLTSATKAVSVVAHAKADKGLIAPVDADVADAASVRATRTKLGADRDLGTALAVLATLLGTDPMIGHIEVQGELTPLSGLDGAIRSLPVDSSARPELQALEAQRRAMELRASAFRRSRIPNPTISAFVANDGFDERVLGLGLSFPIPIPGNVGRTFVGEVAEAEALARRAATDRERARREIRLGVATAAQALESRRLEVEAFTPELLANAETSLRALGQEVESGRLTVREAVVAQQALIDLLQGYVAARREWCLASVDLARAAGVPLERGVQ